MALGPEVSVRHEQTRWKAPLVLLCALFAAWTLASLANYAGFAGPAWRWGWWDVIFFPTSQPYVVKFDPPQPGGAAAHAGIRGGDWMDLREQSLAVRVRLYAQPLAAEPIALAIHRGALHLTVSVVPSTHLQGNARLKVWGALSLLIAAWWFIGCALLIVLQRAWLLEARLLAIILLCDSLGSFADLGLSLVTSGVASTALLFVLPPLCGLVAMLLLVVLSVRFGNRTILRRLVERFAYAAITFNALVIAVFFFGLITLRIDPLRVGLGNFANGFGITEILQTVAAAAVLIASAIAVKSASRAERARAAWLLLPLPVMWTAVIAIYSLFTNFAHTWAAFMGLSVLAGLVSLAGSFAVTYAVLKRRVLDLEFVLSRTLVVATVSLFVVAAFVLLEWLLGAVVTDVSHTTGVIANAALALVLGLSLRYVHKRVDTFVDRAFFRKRHEDERALLDFSKEVAYVTQPCALLDQAIANIERHTDARSAALLLDGSGCYETVRSFGDDHSSVSENDAAILALKAWHKPLDPHRYATELKGALVFPMLARGRLRGIILLGERRGGEAYAPDEIDALAEFAHGVGLALESVSSSGTNEKIANTLDAILEELKGMRRSSSLGS